MIINKLVSNFLQAPYESASSTLFFFILQPAHVTVADARDFVTRTTRGRGRSKCKRDYILVNEEEKHFSRLSLFRTNGHVLLAVLNERHNFIVHDVGAYDTNTTGTNVELYRDQWSSRSWRWHSEKDQRRRGGLHTVQRPARDVLCTDHFSLDPADRPHRKWCASSYDPSALEYEKRAQYICPVPGARRFTGT